MAIVSKEEIERRAQENKREKFREELRIKSEEVELDENSKKRFQRYIKRKDSQLEEKKRRENLTRTIQKIENPQNEDTSEIDYYDEILKTKLQELEEKQKNNEKKKCIKHKKMSGNSFKEIFDSEEFQEIWDEEQEER